MGGNYGVIAASANPRNIAPLQVHPVSIRLQIKCRVAGKQGGYFFIDGQGLDVSDCGEAVHHGGDHSSATAGADGGGSGFGGEVLGHCAPLGVHGGCWKRGVSS